MGIQLVNQNPPVLRRAGDSLAAGLALPELDATKPAKMVPF
jgi:hypothetical protein